MHKQVLKIEEEKKRNLELKILELQPQGITASIEYGRQSESTNEKIAGLQKATVWVAMATMLFIITQSVIFGLQYRELTRQTKILQEQLLLQRISAVGESRSGSVPDILKEKH
ncbi:MAG: hypothetical protein ACHQRM_09560 [Bacteroidia bacterium]